jgi:14-3-3 protein epsilon
MTEIMKHIARENRELSVEERNLLSVAYKNFIGPRRASWRITATNESKEESKGNTSLVKFIKKFRRKIEAELTKICKDVLDILDKHLIPYVESGESKVFFHKL